MALVRSMPSTEVSVEIKTAWDRNSDKRWNPNDIHDIDERRLVVQPNAGLFQAIFEHAPILGLYQHSCWQGTPVRPGG